MTCEVGEQMISPFYKFTVILMLGYHAKSKSIWMGEVATVLYFYAFLLIRVKHCRPNWIVI